MFLFSCITLDYTACFPGPDPEFLPLLKDLQLDTDLDLHLFLDLVRDLLFTKTERGNEKLKWKGKNHHLVYDSSHGCHIFLTPYNIVLVHGLRKQLVLLRGVSEAGPDSRLTPQQDSRSRKTLQLFPEPFTIDPYVGPIRLAASSPMSSVTSPSQCTKSSCRLDSPEPRQCP